MKEGENGKWKKARMWHCFYNLKGRMQNHKTSLHCLCIFQGHFDLIIFLQFHYQNLSSWTIQGNLNSFTNSVYVRNKLICDQTYFLKIAEFESLRGKLSVHIPWNPIFLSYSLYSFFFLALTVCRGGWAIIHHTFNFIHQELLVTYRVKKTW